MRAYEVPVSQMCQSGTCAACCGRRVKAVRWGWVSRNVTSLAELSSRKVAPRGVMSAADLRSVITAGDSGQRNLRSTGSGVLAGRFAG